MALTLIVPPSGAALRLAPFTTAALFVFIGGFLIPLPQEAVLVAIGYFFGDRNLSLPVAMGASVFAVVVSDNIFYAMARFGSPLVMRLKSRLKPSVVEKYSRDMRAHPFRTIFWVRFIPGIRVLAPLLSGLTPSVSLPTYELANAAAAVIYVPIYVALGFFFHGSLDALVNDVETGQDLAFGIALAAMTGVVGYKVWRAYFRNDAKDE